MEDSGDYLNDPLQQNLNGNPFPGLVPSSAEPLVYQLMLLLLGCRNDVVAAGKRSST